VRLACRDATRHEPTVESDGQRLDIRLMVVAHDSLGVLLFRATFTTIHCGGIAEWKATLTRMDVLVIASGFSPLI
jgi:hypothetical protein